MRSSASVQGPVRRDTTSTAERGTVVTLADVRRRWLARQTRAVARPAPEIPTAANLPIFLREVGNGAPERQQCSDIHHFVRFAGVLCGLALLSWLAWDSTPPIEWLRAIGPEEISWLETGEGGAIPG